MVDVPFAKAPSVADILAMNDDEIVELVRQSRRSDGGFTIKCDLSDDTELKKAGERLKFGAAKVNVEEPSRPLDVDLLAAKLLALPDPEDSASQPTLPDPSRAPREPTPAHTPTTDEVRAADAYDDIIKEGGRPAYPLSDYATISENPSAHLDVLGGWQDVHMGGPPDHQVVYGNQLRTWRTFLHWQRDNREEMDNDEEGYAKFLEDKKTWCIREFGSQGLPTFKNTASDYPDIWKNIMNRRRDDLERIRENEGAGGFAEYDEEVHRRLAEHHQFGREFKLERDLSKQSRLATWIEYLYYEYAWHDYYSQGLGRMRGWYEACKARLVETGTVLPGEDVDELRSFDSITRVIDEKIEARTALETAKNRADRDEMSHLCFGLQEGGEDSLTDAQAELRRATDEYDFKEKRAKAVGDFRYKTHDYEIAQDLVRIRDHRVSWVLSQVPLVEAEMVAEAQPKEPADLEEAAAQEAVVGAEEERERLIATSVTGEQGPPVDADGHSDSGEAGGASRKPASDAASVDDAETAGPKEKPAFLSSPTEKPATPAEKHARSVDGDDDAASEHDRKRLKSETPTAATSA